MSYEKRNRGPDLFPLEKKNHHGDLTDTFKVCQILAQIVVQQDLGSLTLDRDTWVAETRSRLVARSPFNSNRIVSI